MSKLWSAVAALGLLQACLDHPLPASPAYVADAPSAVNPAAPESAPNVSYRLQDFGDIAYAQNPVTRETLLIDWLGGLNSQPTLEVLTIERLRTFQSLYVDWAKNASAVAEPRKDDELTPAPERGGAVVALDEGPCVSPAPSFRDLPDSGLRLYTRRPRTDLDACTFRTLKQMERALNRLLDGQAVTIRYRGHARRVESLAGIPAWARAEGFALSASYRLAIANFFKVFRVDAKGGETEIPLPLWIDAGLALPSGHAARVPAPHSEVVFDFARAGAPTLRLRLFFSEHGFVFDDDDESHPAWTGERYLAQFSPAQTRRMLAAAPELAQAFRVFRSRLPGPLPFNGFGLLGVCNDGAALLAARVLGPDFAFPFPLVRTDLVRMPERFPYRDLWSRIVPDTAERLVDEDPRARLLRLRTRLLNGNPFPGAATTGFPEYDELLEELARVTP